MRTFRVFWDSSRGTRTTPSNREKLPSKTKTLLPKKEQGFFVSSRARQV